MPTITKMFEASVVQILMVDQFEVESLRQVVPDVPHLGGTHEPDFSNMHGKTDEVLRARKHSLMVSRIISRSHHLQKMSMLKPATWMKLKSRLQHQNLKMCSMLKMQDRRMLLS